MRLRSMGQLQLEGCSSSKLSTQVLLLMCYVSLEGLPSKSRLAELFWAHLEGAVSKKGERKDLNNVAVALATIKREAGLEADQIRHLHHDASVFLQAYVQEDFERALASYACFLDGLEDKPRLILSSELYSWMMQRREDFARKARQARINLAKQALAIEDFEIARSYLQQAFESDKAWLEPATLGQLYQLMLAAGNESLAQVRQSFESWLEEALAQGLLSTESLKLFLTLALQRSPQLAIAQQAVNLSPRQAMLCLEELISCRLLGAKHSVLAQDLAQHYLEQHPAEHMNLLLALREHSTAAVAYPIYQQLYALSQTFGGMGYWREAREAYTLEAKRFVQQDDFQRAIAILQELEQAETANQVTPEAEPRFLQAYALERLGQINEGLAVLEQAPESDDCLAIRAALLMKAGNFATANQLSKDITTRHARSTTGSWARAIAVNTLGQLAFQKNCLEEAEAYFADACVQWRLAQVKSRELGALMNRANAFFTLGDSKKALQLCDHILAESKAYPTLRVKALLNLGYFQEAEQCWDDVYQSYRQALALVQGEDAALEALILNNLGFASWQRGELQQAKDYFTSAMDKALAVGEQVHYACALGNLAACQEDLSTLEVAIRLLEDIGSEHEVKQYQQLRLELRQKIATKTTKG